MPKKTTQTPLTSPKLTAHQVAEQATPAERLRATEALVNIVESDRTDAEAFQALDQGFELVEGIHQRIAADAALEQ